jgi:hypothetical protein
MIACVLVGLVLLGGMAGAAQGAAPPARLSAIECHHPFDEVAGLIALLGNSHKRLTTLRGEPQIGRYLFPIGEQVFSEIPFDTLHPELAAKRDASAKQFVEEALKKRQPKQSEDAPKEPPESTGQQ